MASGSKEENQIHKFTNRLVHEKSPYLLQHAHNPVNWYPWGKEAFDMAKTENKPIFLSVGYSTCHWCHVMEHESFEDEDIANILNEYFVPIKVDREERPDVDRVYMTFIQATSGGGGWPMSVWLTPDLKPFFGGTYFPPKSQFFRRGFEDVLKIIADQWKTKQDKVIESGNHIIDALQEATSASNETGELPSIDCSHKLFKDFLKSFDDELGGFGGAPKFPQPVNFSFLLRYSLQPSNKANGKKALEMCSHTLEAMLKGGIHDHIGQGFHRYSTDAYWHVPHFEKMLYDQGQLAVAYAEAYQVTKESVFAETTRDILSYVSRDLGQKEGGFFSAEDADSLPTYESEKKKEGAFCVWTYSELQDLLSNSLIDDTKISLADLFCSFYDVKKNGNVRPGQDPHGELTNQNVLMATSSLKEEAKKFEISEKLAMESLKKCKTILSEQRKKRPPPHLDTKMITAWNGLMISGFSKASQALDDKTYFDRAVKATEFVNEHLYDKENGKLYRSVYCEGRDGNAEQIDHPVYGFIDDYAFLIRALLDLYETGFDDRWLQWAADLQTKQDELFWDEKNGGYFEVTTEDASILLRMKEAQDGAEPSANSVSASNLLRLSGFLNKTDYRDKASKIFSVFEKQINKMPMALPEMISAFMFYHSTPKQIIISGDPNSDDTKILIREVHRRFIPNKILICNNSAEENSYLSTHLPILKSMEKLDGKPAAYVCENYSCSLPVNNIGELTKLLE